MDKSTAVRRMAVEGAETRVLLIESAMQLLRDVGATAMTARQVAAKAGVKTPLIYYYFRTMDDLLLAVVRRVAESRLQRFEKVKVSPRPLRALWELNSDPASAILSSELISLASHREVIRAEMARTAEHFRELQIAAVKGWLKGRGVDERAYPAAGLVMLMTGLSRVMVTESALEISVGHEQALALVERTLEQLEGQAACPA